MQRHPILYPHIKSNYNNNNLHEYDPYIIKDNRVIIDQSWWNTLTNDIKDTITGKINNFILEDIIVPHPISEDNKEKHLKVIYEAYFHGFDYHVWYTPFIPNGPQDVHLIIIPKPIKMILKTMFMTGNKHISDKSEELNDFKQKITKVMHGGPYFVRLSSTSGKNEVAIKPLYSADEVIKHITSNKLFVFQEYDVEKDSYIIIMPWREIDERYEFRIFVVNGKLTGASIQKWFDLIQHTQEELEIFEEVLTIIPFLDSFESKTYIADVTIDIDTKQCHLIEINPFGAHCGAGSSLFNWVTDYDILHNNHTDVQLRYLSIINY